MCGRPKRYHETALLASAIWRQVQALPCVHTGEATSSEALLPLPPCLADAGGGQTDTAPADPGGAESSTSPRPRGSSASAKVQQAGVCMEMHTCGGGRCECTRRRMLPAPHAESGRGQDAPATRSSAASGTAAPATSSNAAAGANSDALTGSGGSSGNPCSTSQAADASAADDLVTHRSVSADGVLTLRLRPSQPHAVEDPERRKLANAAFIKALAARSGRAEASPAASSSDDEDQFLDSLLRSVAAAGNGAPPAAEAAAAAAATTSAPVAGTTAASSRSSGEPAPPQQAADAPVPLRKHESVSRITVDFLDQNGYFDRPMQDAAAELKVSATTLKKICRAHGIQRWPYRKRNHVHQLLKKSVAMISRKPKKQRAAAPAGPECDQEL